MYSFNGMLRKAVYKTAAQSQKLVSFLVMARRLLASLSEYSYHLLFFRQ